MQRRNLLGILLMTLIITIITSLPIKTEATPTTTVTVSPMTVTDINVDETFTVNLTVADVNKLWGYQIYLKYNTTVLTATSFQNIADLVYEPFKDPEYSEIRDDEGFLVMAYHSFMGDATGFTTDATVPLATVTFRVDANGTSKLELGASVPTKSKLVDADGNAIDPDWNLILVSGHFSNVGEIKLHDIAITKVEASPTEVSLRDIVSIEVTFQNNGGFNENFTVSAYYSVTHKIGTLQVTDLAPAASDSLTFTWDTAGVSEGSYVVSAKAEVANEDNPTDNTLSGNTVRIGIPSTGLPVNILYLLGGVVIVIVVAIGVYVLRARKPK